jgi:uncharacterized delta-60 repeat protein
MSKATKFLASVAALALVITGLTVMPAEAGGVNAPYTVAEVKSGMSVSSELVAATNRVFWKNGPELWTSDGVTTQSVHTFVAHDAFALTQSTPQYTESGFFDNSYYIHRSAVIGDTVYFWAQGGDNLWDIWKSNGTVAGTVKVTNLAIWYGVRNSGQTPPSLFANGTDIFFWAWRTDGQGGQFRDLRKLNTVNGTSAVVANSPTTEICPNQTYGQEYAFAVVSGKLIFDYTLGCVNRIGSINLTSGTFADLQPASLTAGSQLGLINPSEFVVFNNKVYFIGQVLSASDLAQNTQWNWTSELWSTDGTVAGTAQVSDLNPGGYGIGNPKAPMMRPAVIGSYLYFLGWDSNLGRNSVYRTDGISTPVLWISGDTLGNAGARTNSPANWVTAAGTTYLIVDATHSSGGQQMYSVNLTTKAVTWLTPTLPASMDAVGTIDQPWAATDYTTPIAWDGKVWWVGRTNADNPGSALNLSYTDGTVAATDTITQFSGDNNQGIGFIGDNADIDQFSRNATIPLVATANNVWFLRGPGSWQATTWSLYKVSVASVTPPPPPALTCAGEMTKLKVEAESATSLDPVFNKNTCEYSVKVDAKATKADITPTFSPANATVKVAGTSVTTTLKTTKTQSVTLGASGTSTQVDIVFGGTTYRINIQRGAPAVSGAKAPTFTPPTISAPVKTVDKDQKKEVNADGDKKNVEVTIIGGDFEKKVAKLDENGKKDEVFAAKLPEINGTVEKVKVDDEHRIIVAGDFTTPDGDKDIIRLKPDGSKDKSFDAPELGGSNAKVKDVDIQKDGKIIVVGDLDEPSKSNVKRLKDDGKEDTGFESKLPDINGEVKAVKIQDDGKILLGGHFENVGGDNDKDKIARVEKDGSIDNSFKPATNGAHFNDDVEDIETQKDGKIIVVGKSNKDNDNEADQVTRLKKDGKEDETFNFDGVIPAGKKVESVKVRDTGDIYIAGDFDNVGDDEGDKIAKVKKDGHVDTDFNPEHHDGDVHDIELEKHGKVFLGGEGTGNGDRVDKLEQDGDDTPRYDSIDNDRSANKVPTGDSGHTHIHGDGFTPDTVVTIGGQPARVVGVDDRGEDLEIEVPTPNNTNKGGSDHNRKPADVVITVPGEDPITVSEAFGYTDRPEAQKITPNGDHFNSDKDDEDKKGKVQDDEAITGNIPSGEPVVATSLTPDVCTVDDENRVHYEKRGDCKIVVDAPATLGYADPAPVTEVIPVAGIDPQLAPPVLPDLTVPSVPDTGYQLPPAVTADPEIPVVYVPTTPDVCVVGADGVVTPIDASLDCTIQVTTPGTPIYEPTAPTSPPVTFTVPHTAWIPPTPVNGVVTEPAVPSVSIPGTGGTAMLGNDLGFKYDKAKGTLTPTAWGIYFGPIKATINYSWTKSDSSTGTGTCVVNWGVLKKWSKLSKADQKKYKKPLAAKVFTTTANCKVNPAAKAALAVAGTTFTATSDVLRTRMWPATYKPEKPIIPGVRLQPVPIEPRTRHYTLVINTQ